MGIFTLPHLFERQGRLYYRRIVPRDVRDVIGKREWKKSLKLQKGQEADALAECQRLDMGYDREIAAARTGRVNLAETPSMLAHEAQVTARKLARDMGYFEDAHLSPSEGEEAQRWDDAERIWARGVKRLQKDYGWSDEKARHEAWRCGRPPGDPSGFSHRVYGYLKAHEKYLIEIIRNGEMSPTPVPRLTEAYQEDVVRLTRPRDEKPFKIAVRDFVGYVGDLPIDRITHRDVERWVQHCIEDKGQKPSTVRRRVNALKSLHNRILHRYELENRKPFSHLDQLREDRDPAEQRLPFHTSHLDCVDRIIKGDVRTEESVRLILSLLRYTGARLGEVTGLEVADVITEAPIPFIMIRPNATREHLKTRGSIRNVPIPAFLCEGVRLGLAASSGPAVFPAHAGKQATNSLSQRIAKLIRRAGIPKSPRLTAHSFRHTLKEAMRAASVEARVQDRILGHSSGAVSERYGSPQDDLKRLTRALEASYPFMGDVPISIFRPNEMVSSAGCTPATPIDVSVV